MYANSIEFEFNFHKVYIYPSHDEVDSMVMIPFYIME